MKSLLTAALFLTLLRGSAQDTARNSLQDLPPDIIFTQVEVPPEYPGGHNSLQRFMERNLRYPREARKNHIMGTVVVQFIVDQQGAVSDIRAISGPETAGLREEAVRLVKTSGKWTPAIQNGRQVKAFTKLPVIFRLGP